MSLVKFTPEKKHPKRVNNTRNGPFTIPIGKIKPLIKMLVAEGTSLQQLLEGTGISLSDLTLFDLSINLAQYLHLIENAYRLAPSPGFAFRLGEQFYVNHDGALACRAMSCDNGLEAMRLLADYQSLLTHLFKLSFDVFEEHAVFTVQPAHELNASLPFFIEYTFAAIYSLGKFCTGNKNFELSYELSYESPAPNDQDIAYFGPQIRFGCKQNRVLIPLSVLQQPFIFADKQAAQMNDDICQEKIRDSEQNVDIQQRVKVFIQKSKLSNISFDVLAEELCMTPRTLRRQLKALNISYKMILEEERKKSAIQQMKEKDIPLEQLAEQLGYRDASSFSRAFKQWFGVAPNTFKYSQFIDQECPKMHSK